MDRDTTRWLIISAALALWASLSGGALLPVSLLVLALAATARLPTRGWLLNLALDLFSYGFVRGLVIIVAGAMFIQFLPLELAMFAAADVLAYVEVAAAVAMIAANVRLKAMGAVVVRRWRISRTRTIRRAGRAIRITRRRLARPRASEDPDGWAFA